MDHDKDTCVNKPQNDVSESKEIVVSLLHQLIDENINSQEKVLSLEETKTDFIVPVPVVEYSIDKVPDFDVEKLNKKSPVDDVKSGDLLLKSTNAFLNLRNSYKSDSSSGTNSSDDESDSEDSESDSSSSSEESEDMSSDESDTLSSETESHVSHERHKKPKFKKKNPNMLDVNMEDLPRIDDLHISVPEESCLEIGTVTSIIDSIVIVSANRNTPALDIGSVLFLVKGEKTLGRVFDVIGPVQEPAYLVRFNSHEHIISNGIQTSMKVYYAPKTDYTCFVFVPDLLKMKGSDASWLDNHEPPPEFQDFSDDEEEKRAGRKSCAPFRRTNMSSESGTPQKKVFRRSFNSTRRGQNRQHDGATTCNQAANNSYYPVNYQYQMPPMYYGYNPYPNLSVPPPNMRGIPPPNIYGAPPPHVPGLQPLDVHRPQLPNTSPRPVFYPFYTQPPPPPPPSSS